MGSRYHPATFAAVPRYSGRAQTFIPFVWVRYVRLKQRPSAAAVLAASRSCGAGRVLFSFCYRCTCSHYRTATMPPPLPLPVSPPPTILGARRIFLFRICISICFLGFRNGFRRRRSGRHPVFWAGRVLVSRRLVPFSH
ncbi:unnamed protein product, partial [Pylaiella littoralis]